MQIVIKFLINVHLLVNELCEYQNVRCNDKKKKLSLVYLEVRRYLPTID